MVDMSYVFIELVFSRTRFSNLLVKCYLYVSLFVSQLISLMFLLPLHV